MNSNGYIYVTEDLAERDDFLKPNRFNSYKNQITKKIKFKKNEMILVLSNSKKVFYRPVVDLNTIMNKHGNTFETKYNQFTADYQLNRNNIKFAFIGLHSDSSLFDKLIHKKIPFAIVAPHNKKCEWFVLNGKESCPYTPCVICNDYDNQRCQDHDTIYCSAKAKNFLKSYFCKLYNVLEDEYKNLDAIPIFEYSTAIDIVRWFVFNQEISTIITTKKSNQERLSFDDSNYKEYQKQNIIEKVGHFFSSNLQPK